MTILKEPDVKLKQFRLFMIELIAKVLVKGMDILGIKLPERM